MPSGIVEREVDADVHAAVAEVAVRDAVETVFGEQHVLLAQVGAQAIRRHCRVFPAREGLARERTSGESGALLADAPQDGLLSRVGHDAAVERRRSS